jgi:hypothetical protein
MGSFSFMVTAELPREANGPPPALACELANCRIAAPATVSPAPAPPDTTAPQTLLQRTLLRAGKRTAKFWFSASEPAVGFRCKLDKKGYKPCGSPRAYKHLRPGRHTFRAEAVDLAGNVDPSALVVHFRLARPSSRR